MTTVELNYEAAGPEDAPVLLLGPSLGTTTAMWEPQLPVLTRTHRVVRFDPRGHGGSPVPPGPYSIDELGGDVVALLDRLGVARASYCGLSMGGMIGQWLGIHAADRLERLALICTAAHMAPPSAWHERAATVRDAGTPGAVADGVVARWFTPEFAQREPGVVAGFRAMIAATAAEGYAGCCEALADFDVRAELPRVGAPTLVIAGAQDPSTPPEHGEAIAAAIPGARFELLDPAAHLSSVERAETVTTLLAEHLNSEGTR